jgi:acetaldehyde dehydrogenase
VNIEGHLHEWNVNMVTCGGQATVPIVAAVTSETEVPYAEIISTIASRSAGPGTRQNIDEFTRVTGNSLIDIGGARSGKAIIILNPAEPPMIMRNTVFCGLSENADRASIRRSIEAMVERVQLFVPGYRLKSPPVFDDGPYETAAGSIAARVVVFLEVEGSGDYLPSYAGNLDIMTAAAVRTGEAMVSASQEVMS